MSGLSGASCLVCGGAGFIGSHLVDGLLDRGVSSIQVIDDFSLGRRENLAPVLERSDIVLVEGDCTDLEGLKRLAGARPFDLCFNLAVIPLPASLEEPRPTVDRNVAMTSAVCELGRVGGYSRLVQFSSSEVYGTAEVLPMSEEHPFRPTTPYAASKAATDLVALSYGATFGLEVAVVRPFNVFGPRQNPGIYAGLIPVVINRVLTGEPVTVHGDGEQTRDYVFVSDVVAATLSIAILDAALGRSVNIASGSERTVNELVAAILDALGEPDWPVVHVDPRPGDVRRLLGDITLARDLVGYRPEVTLEAGLLETVDWYRSRPMRTLPEPR
jgi:UDP-glucose 4-epimerase